MIHIGQRSQPLDHQFERKPGFDHWTLGRMLSGSSYMQYANEEIMKLAHCITLTPPRHTLPSTLRWTGKNMVRDVGNLPSITGLP